jgi:glyoxylase-like metal-dependent hydrolase (beta-lactamase superfamily II)
MRRVVFCAVAALVALVSVPSAQQQADKIKAASDYLGSGNMKSVRFTGFGANYTVGQPWSPTDAWPKVNVKSYDAQINYETTALQLDLVREQGPTAPRGGGVPFVGEQRQQQFVVGTVAWDNPAPAAPGGGRGRGGAAGGARAGGGPPEPGRVTLQEAMAFAGIQPPAPAITPQPAAGVDRMLQIYLTPHGFLRGAAANNATTRTVPGGTEVSYTLQGKYKLTGLINARNEVEKVSTFTSNPVLGDMPIEVTYSNYQKTDADTMFPLRIVQRTGGHVSLELWVSSVLTNPAPPTTIDPRNAPSNVNTFDPSVPAAARNATIPAPVVNADKIGEGIFHMTGGTHHSVAIEMRDHIILVEAPLNEARSLAVIAKVKETIPNKPIKYVVNTHVHFDHSGGLRTLVNEGATVVTQQANRAFYQKAWSQPHTLTPDLLSQSKKTPTFLTFLDKQVLTDGRRTVEIYRIQNSNHNDSFAMVYVPSAKLLIEADAYTAPAAPAPGQARAGGAPAAPAAGGRAGAAPPAAPAGPNPETVNLYANIQRLKLDVAQIAGLHGRVATIDELKAAATPPAPAADAGQ